jgi:LacI family transcriptional regulator
VVGIKDVAERAGVSTATVSLVLNGSPSRISEATAEVVRRAASELDYRPDPTARSLRTKRTQMIGLLSDYIVTTPYAGQMIRGAQEAAWERGHLVLIANTEGEHEREDGLISALLARRLDGYLYASMFHRVDRMPAALSGMPIVGLDVELGNAGPSFVPDDFRGGKEAAEILLAAGHHRIGHLGGRLSTPATAMRSEAFSQALTAAGSFDPSLVVYYPEDDPQSASEFGEEAALGLLRRADRPTALFAFNDQMAIGVFRAAAKLGLRIPEDLSVVGFDNQELIAEELRPQLTTLQLPHLEMGRRATSRLIDLLLGVGDPTPTIERLLCPVVHRASVGPPPSESALVR